jgi:two-component system sensor histidine kinase TctE
VDLVALAKRVTQEHLLRAHQAGDDLGLEALVAHCEVQGVDLLLHEALSNLIDNALHHGPAGTHITVRVDEAGFEVQDDGPGIAPEHHAHVFERFYRAAPSGVTGSGLGLAIVKEIASQHGAEVQVTSPVSEGRGTVIRMHWPQR